MEFHKSTWRAGVAHSGRIWLNSLWGILALLDITWLSSLLGFLPLLCLVLLCLPWDRCLWVPQHPNASGLGSVASSLVTCCLAELPPFGFNRRPLADNSKSSQELCLHPDLFPPGLLLPRVLWTSAWQTEVIISTFTPPLTTSPVFYSLVSGINANSRCQPRNLDNVLELFFLSLVLPDTSPVRVSHQIISATCTFHSISLNCVFILAALFLTVTLTFHCSSYLNGSPTISLKPKTDLFLVLLKNFLKFLEMIFKALSWKIEIDYYLTPAPLSNMFLDGKDHGTQGFHNFCWVNKCVFFFWLSWKWHRYISAWGSVT